ncbi:MAG TPA: hypothetical protein VJ729_10395 [Nitrososphaeraceae archaeon]|nr:hypothetical protein [Nitrososphaeraceae archaeon]
MENNTHINGDKTYEKQGLQQKFISKINLSKSGYVLPVKIDNIVNGKNYY